MRRFTTENLFLIASMAVFASLLLKHVSYPLLWQDEAETAMFATRIVEFGYPKVHGERNVLYEFGRNIAVGVEEVSDAYIGTTWGHFYFAVPGILWARSAPDRYAATARVRLPFALAGALGVGIWVLAFLPLFRGRPRAARVFAGCFCLSAAVSISLLLHLREARYYPLLVALAGAIVWVVLRQRVFGGLRPGRYAASLGLLLIAVFHVFFAAWFFLVALLGVEALIAIAREPAERGRTALTLLAPLALSALGVAPALAYFETLQIAAAFRADLGLTLAGYAANLREWVAHSWRQEFLAPALIARLAVLATASWLRRRGVEAGGRDAQRVAGLLSGFIVGYVLLTCLNPLVYERYFVVLSPALIALFLVDSFTLVDLAAARVPERVPSPRRLTALALLALVVATSGARFDALRGRLVEITTPYRGPLDFAIERIAARHPDPTRLVIATNYANHPFMYYLGSHVIVGTNLNNIVRERGLVPDVVILRRRWPRGQAELRGFLARGGYRSEALPVRDTHFNNIPALTRSRSIPDVHHFVTPEPGPRATALEIHWLEPDR